MKGCTQTAVLAIGLLLLGWSAGGRADAQGRTAGYSSGSLYNLANAYAREGKPGMAVLNYERARLLAPDDPDVEANLFVVRRSLGLPTEPRRWLDRTVGAANPTLASWVGIIGLSLVAAGVLAGRLGVRHRWARRAATLVGIALMALTAANGWVLWPRLHEAIIIARAAPVRVSPAPMGDALFALKEAEAVRLVGEHEGFVLVRTRAGRTGWVWHADLVPVVPRN